MNNSGVYPRGDRVLVKPDKLEEVTKGGIIIPEADRDKHQMAALTGIVVEVGPDAWRHSIETVERLINGTWKTVERRTTGYSEPFARVGDRVSYARYSGLQIDGKDGEEYRILNDEDITTIIDPEVDFTEFRKRERM